MYKSISVDRIILGKNSRIQYKREELLDLMSSLKREGMLQPIGVRKVKKGFETIYGNRRFLAAKRLDWPTVPVRIHEGKTDQDALVMNITENLKRRNTTMYEDGVAFRDLVDTGLTPGEIAVRLDISKVRVQGALSAAGVLTEEEQKRVVHNVGGGKNKPRGVVGSSTAIALVNLTKKKKLSRSQARKLFKEAKEGNVTDANLKHVADLVGAGHQLSTALSWANSVKLVSTRIFMKEKTIAKLEKKYKMSINDILAKKLCASSELDAIPANPELRKQLKPDFKVRRA